MKSNSQKIETQQIFPYIAWGTVIIFTFFVYSLALELRAVSENLKETTSNVRQKEYEFIHSPTTTSTISEKLRL